MSELEGADLEKCESEKDVSWIDILVVEISLLNQVEFENMNNSSFWDFEEYP